MDHDTPVPPEDAANKDHAPGSVDPESSEPQIPRLGEGGGAPGARDPSRATADEPIYGAAVSGGRPDVPAMDQEPRGASVGAGRGVERTFQKNRQPQPDAPEGIEDGQQQAFQGAGYPEADMDGEAEDLSGDVTRDMDPEASHVVPGMAPAEEVAEDEPEDVSIIGQGHLDKAAWNRERTSHAQPGYDVVADGGPGMATPGSSEDMGYGGGAPAEDADVPGTGTGTGTGMDTGDGRLDDLAEDDDDALEDAADALDDPTNRAGRAGAAPDLPEDRDLPDQGVSPEETILADDNEDAMFASAELGDEDDLEMEEMNETDDVARDFEDQRSDMDDGATGNERSAGI